MKGVILAGGTGSRLYPLTKVVNKHLLPIGGKPMLQHCVEKLVEAEITDIMVITGGEHLGGIAEFLGSGKDFDCNVTYRVQDRAGGIAEALGLCEDFALTNGGGQVCVLLGDNVFEDSLLPFRREWEDSSFGAMNILKEVPDPERFGVADVHEGRIVGIEEKPKVPKSNLAVTGIYFYNEYAFKVARDLEPSARGELEISDINNAYIACGEMACERFIGWWSDAGTHESYAVANKLARGE